ncbi:hypothetical protein ABZP36_032119 [Zizania latifolia]
MEVADKTVELKGPSVATAQLPNNVELLRSVVLNASREGESSLEQYEKDLMAEGEESFRSEESSDECARSSFSGVSHPPEPIDVDLMSTVYVAIDEEKPEPPDCLMRGLSAKGPSMDDLTIHVMDAKLDVVVGRGSVNGLVEERKVQGAAVAPCHVAHGPELVEAVSSTQALEEKGCVWDASLPPSGNVSPHSSSDSTSVVASTSIRRSSTSTCRSGVVTSESLLTGEKTCESTKGRVRGNSMESAKTSMSRASDSSGISDESNWSNITGSASKPHKGNDPRWRAILAVRGRGNVLGMSHFRLLKRLGCGDIGSVYLSELSGTRCYFAMKVMDKASLASRKKLNRAQTEREILQLLDHPFLPTLYTHFETDRFSCLVMEFCPGGDLHTLRQRQPRKHFSEYAARFYSGLVTSSVQ